MLCVGLTIVLLVVINAVFDVEDRMCEMFSVCSLGENCNCSLIVSFYVRLFEQFD